jgi:hypothetical protein
MSFAGVPTRPAPVRNRGKRRAQNAAQPQQVPSGPAQSRPNVVVSRPLEAKTQGEKLLNRYKEFMPNLHVRMELSAQYGLISTEFRFSKSDLQDLGVKFGQLNFDQNGFAWKDLPSAEPLLLAVEESAKINLAVQRAPKRLGRSITSLEGLSDVEQRMLHMGAQEWASKVAQAYNVWVSLPENTAGDWADIPLNPNSFIGMNFAKDFFKKFLLGEIKIPHKPVAPKKESTLVPQVEVPEEGPEGVPLAPVSTGDRRAPPVGPKSTRS